MTGPVFRGLVRAAQEGAQRPSTFTKTDYSKVAVLTALLKGNGLTEDGIATRAAAKLGRDRYRFSLGGGISIRDFLKEAIEAGYVEQTRRGGVDLPARFSLTPAGRTLGQRFVSVIRRRKEG